MKIIFTYKQAFKGVRSNKTLKSNKGTKDADEYNI